MLLQTIMENRIFKDQLLKRSKAVSKSTAGFAGKIQLKKAKLKSKSNLQTAKSIENSMLFVFSISHYWSKDKTLCDWLLA